MKKALVAVVVVAMLVAVVPIVAFAAPAPTMISNTADLVAAIEAQKSDATPDQTWILAPGTYDLPRFPNASVPSTATGGQDMWYFPIILEGLTVKGDGTGEVILTSTTFSANGAWSSQDFISVWANGVTIENMTLVCKLETNKAIEVMGKDFTIKNTKFLTNPGQQDGGEFYEFAGSLYFNPQVSVTGAAGDVGDSRVEDVFIESAWMAASTSKVTTGTVTLSGLTLDYIEAGYAPYELYGMMSSNPLIIVENDVYFIVDETLASLTQQATGRMPAGATLQLTGVPSQTTTIAGDSFTVLKNGGVYPASGEMTFSYEETSTGITPYSWTFPIPTLYPSYDTTFFPYVDVATTVDTDVADMIAAADLPASGQEVIEMDCAHTGSLPGPGDLTIYADPALAGMQFELYRYEPSGDPHLQPTGRLSTVDATGYVTVSIDEGDVWYLLGFNSKRVYGSTRYGTAIEISQEHFPSADTAVISTGRLFADALAASGLAGAYSAPVLLTQPTYLPTDVAAELQRLGVSKVIVTGGVGAVSEAVVAEIEALGGITVQRIGGIDRYETAQLLAEEVETVVGSTPAMTFIARGDLFPDALSASPIAWANKAPVLLTRTTTLSGYAAEYLTASTPDDAIVVGGTGAVSEGVEQAVDAIVGSTERVDGATRYATAAALAEWADVGALADVWFTGVATGQNFPDALTGGAGTGARGGVMLLTRNANVPVYTGTFIDTNEAGIDVVNIYGGTGVVSQGVMDEIFSRAGVTAVP